MADVLTAQQIVTFDDNPPPPGESPWVAGQEATTDLRVVAADPCWPEQYGRLARLITAALGGSALSVEHVGSTAVPDLPAKPVIDIDLIVTDPRDEQAYAETERHRIFRDWLRSHPADRLLYGNAKIAAVDETKAQVGNTIDYNACKESVLREIYDRAFHGLGLLT